MTIVLVRLASLAAAALALMACAHNVEAHCDLKAGVWSCTGGASGPVAM